MSRVSATGASGENLGIDQVSRAIDISDATQLENNFITLMVAQIQNQDPTNPLDSGEFLSQYSAMSQVKSMENMVSLGQNNLVLLDNLQTLTASSLVGQDVKVSVNALELDGTPLSGELELEHAAGTTTLVLTDSLGRSTEIQLGQQAPGRAAFSIDPVALGLAPGRYSVSASTDSGEYPAVQVSGQVSHVRVSNEGPVLQVSGIGAVPFYNITEFGQSPSRLP
jgi:flagellar basal-body rod modification protein FlgD